MKKFVRLVARAATALTIGLAGVLGAPTVVSAAECYGQFPNPVTDVCWSCIFPMKLGSTTMVESGQEDNGSTSDGWFCYCIDGINSQVGVAISFWEPARIAEVVREPYCFPAMGGVTMNAGVQAPRHTRMKGHGQRGGSRTGLSFYQAHWYVNPVLFYLEALIDTRCLEQNVFDLAYITELDPLWNDSKATFILNPDAVLFANPISKAVCAADCVAASIGFPLDDAFWCAGCQGSMYPLTGYVPAHVGGVQASSLVVQRLTNKLHRQGLMWSASGEAGQCGFYVEPLMKKSNYKYSMLYPSRQTEKINGRCCQPFGRTTMDWGSGREFPIRGEDFSYQIFRKRDCCQGAW